MAVNEQPPTLPSIGLCHPNVVGESAVMVISSNLCGIHAQSNGGSRIPRVVHQVPGHKYCQLPVPSSCQCI
ncbi:hypothetical protein LSAT2_006367 [Lamellibrachia satsuma]|nr:hypothetical protein LSAT2_006367 [Lamellibrachia satsuma]